MKLELKEIQNQVRERERNSKTEIIFPVIKEIDQALKVITINDALRIRKEQDQFADKSIDETWLKLQIQAVLDSKESLLGPYEGIDDCWKDQPCFVVGGSMGLRNAMNEGFKFNMLNGYHSIGINHVISDYHDFEWFILQDKRFFDIATYDVRNHYKGKIFAHIRTRMTPSEHVTITYTQETGPTNKIINGLYSFIATGIAAINLAIISGANPIYLLGIDNGGLKNDRGVTHYKKDYPGQLANCRGWPKYLTKVPEKCEKFKEFAKDRIYNVDPLGDIKVFKKISWIEVMQRENIK